MKGLYFNNLFVKLLIVLLLADKNHPEVLVTDDERLNPYIVTGSTNRDGTILELPDKRQETVNYGISKLPYTDFNS